MSTSVPLSARPAFVSTGAKADATSLNRSWNRSTCSRWLHCAHRSLNSGSCWGSVVKRQMRQEAIILRYIMIYQPYPSRQECMDTHRYHQCQIHPNKNVLFSGIRGSLTHSWACLRIIDTRNTNIMVMEKTPRIGGTPFMDKPMNILIKISSLSLPFMKNYGQHATKSKLKQHAGSQTHISLWRALNFRVSCWPSARTGTAYLEHYPGWMTSAILNMVALLWKCFFQLLPLSSTFQCPKMSKVKYLVSKNHGSYLELLGDFIFGPVTMKLLPSLSQPPATSEAAGRGHSWPSMEPSMAIHGPSPWIPMELPQPPSTKTFGHSELLSQSRCATGLTTDRCGCLWIASRLVPSINAYVFF